MTLLATGNRCIGIDRADLGDEAAGSRGGSPAGGWERRLEAGSRGGSPAGFGRGVGVGPASLGPSAIAELSVHDPAGRRTDVTPRDTS